VRERKRRRKERRGGNESRQQRARTTMRARATMSTDDNECKDDNECGRQRMWTTTNADDNESKDDNGRTTTKREHNDEGQGRDKEEPPTKLLTSQCARRCQLTPALLLRGFSVAFGGIPMHGLHTPGFSDCTRTRRNPSGHAYVFSGIQWCVSLFLFQIHNPSTYTICTTEDGLRAGGNSVSMK